MKIWQNTQKSIPTDIKKYPRIILSCYFFAYFVKYIREYTIRSCEIETDKRKIKKNYGNHEILNIFIFFFILRYSILSIIASKLDGIVSYRICIILVGTSSSLKNINDRHLLLYYTFGHLKCWMFLLV